MTTDTVLPLRTDRRLGWRPEPPDQRDIPFDYKRVLRKLKQRLPAKVDLRDLELHDPVCDQLDLGSCVLNAGGKAYEFAQRKQGLVDYLPARLAMYYWVREIEGTVNWDSGAYIRDALKVMNKLGAPHESLWPYQPSRFTVRPTAPVYADGELHQALGYRSVEVKTTAVKAALAAGFPVIVGFTVYSSFYDIDADGFMKVPKSNERVEGGHAVLQMGYRRMKAPWDAYAKDYGIYLNSWSDTWGDGGFFYAPHGWMCNRANADDFWTLTEAEA